MARIVGGIGTSAVRLDELAVFLGKLIEAAVQVGAPIYSTGTRASTATDESRPRMQPVRGRGGAG